MATRLKTTNYFSHDSNARNDEKIIRLRMKHNAAGYGVFFMILERLREDAGYMSVKDYNMIAFDLRVDAALVKSVVEDFGLFVFTEDGKYFYSDSFKRRMDIKDTLTRKRSEGGKAAMKKRWNKQKVTPKAEDVEETPPTPKAAPVPKAAPIATEQPTDNNDAYLTRFFRKRNQANIEVLLMNFGLQPADLPKLKKLAKEVVSEWKATDKIHTDYTDWSRHLVSTMRIKCASCSTERKKPDKEQKPPASSDYTYDGGFGSKDT